MKKKWWDKLKTYKMKNFITYDKDDFSVDEDSYKLENMKQLSLLKNLDNNTYQDNFKLNIEISIFYNKYLNDLYNVGLSVFDLYMIDNRDLDYEIYKNLENFIYKILTNNKY